MPTFGPTSTTTPAKASKPASGGGGGKKPAGKPIPKTFLGNWQRRAASLQSAGYSPKHIQAAFAYDLNNVKGGSKPLTDVQAYLAAHAIASGKDLLQRQRAKMGIEAETAGGFFSDVGGDVDTLVSQIPKMPGAIFKAAEVGTAEIAKRAVGAGFVTPWNQLVDKAYGELPGYNEAQKQQAKAGAGFVKGIERGDAGKALRSLDTGPATAFIPGLYTASNVASGDWNTILHHPLMTALDVLPVAAKVGEVGALRTGFEAGSAGEAFAQGDVPKGLFRAALGKTDVPKSIQGADILKSGEATKLPRTSELVRSVAEERGWDRPTREEAYRRIEVVKREVQTKINNVGQTYLDIFGKDQAANTAIKAVLEGRAKIDTLPVELKPVVAEYMKIDQKAVADGVVAGKLRQVPYQGELHVYDATHPVVKAFDKADTATVKAETLAGSYGVGDPRTIKAMADAKALQDKFVKTFTNKPSRIWHPLVYDQTVPAMQALYEVERNKGNLSPSTYEKYTKGLSEGWIPHEFEKQFNAEMDAAAKYWYKDFKQGVRPVYVPNVSEDAVRAVAHASPIPDQVTNPRPYRAASLHSFRPGVASLAAALTWRDAHIFLSDASRQLVQTWSDVFSKSAEDVRAYETMRYDQTHTKVGSFSSREAKINAAIKRNWVSFDEEFGTRVGGTSRIERPNDMLIPRNTSKAINARLSQFSDPSRAGMVWDKGTKTFRIAVTTSPRHVVHVTTAGAMYALGEQGLAPFMRLRDSLSFIKSGKFDSMPELQSGVRMAAGYANDDLRTMFDGQVMGEVLRQHLESRAPIAGKIMGGPGAAFHWLHEFESKISKMWKTASYLTEYDKQIARGATDDAAMVQAIQTANHIHMDTDAMTPLERTITRTIMPFYSFQRQLLRYMFRYPGDHPVAISMISAAARMEEGDQGTGLPGAFATFVTIPKALRPVTDFAMGGTTTSFDIKTLNPFRNFGEGRAPWTFAGFISSLNPAFRGPLEYAGINTLSTNVDQYLGSHVDPQTGSLVTNPTQSFWSAMIKAYVPQSSIPVLSTLLGSSTYLDQLAQTDPSAYRKTLMSILGVPFAPFDAQENKYRIKMQLNYYRVAQQQVSAALKSGDLSSLDQFDYVPYHGSLYTPPQLGKLPAVQATVKANG